MPIENKELSLFLLLGLQAWQWHIPQGRVHGRYLSNVSQARDMYKLKVNQSFSVVFL